MVIIQVTLVNTERPRSERPEKPVIVAKKPNKGGPWPFALSLPSHVSGRSLSTIPHVPVFLAPLSLGFVYLCHDPCLCKAHWRQLVCVVAGTAARVRFGTRPVQASRPSMASTLSAELNAPLASGEMKPPWSPEQSCRDR